VTVTRDDRREAAPPAAPALALSGVSLTLRRPGAAPLRLVDEVSLRLARGERLALVGESGSGKSVLARAVLGLDRDIEVSGEIRVGELSLAGMGERQLRQVRGRRVAMVFQNPMGALDPLMTIGAQLTEPMRYRGVTGRAARTAAAALLSDLGIADAARRLRAYPHEFSGGMRQRVALAMALAAEPEILLADEPTTALDVRAQEQVMALIDGVTRDRGLSVLLISHDLALVAGFADRVAVMYAGRIVHDDPVDAVFAEPAHPYTRGLLGAIPRLDQRFDRLPAIEGTMPPPGRRPGGCAFHPRCTSRLGHCAEIQPATVPTARGGAVACHLFGQDQLFGQAQESALPAGFPATAPATSTGGQP
jgi:peptide/nickel transport system ATP-binding protein